MRSDALRNTSIQHRRLASSRWSHRAAMSKQGFIGLVAGWSAAVLGVFLVSLLARAWG